MQHKLWLTVSAVLTLLLFGADTAVASGTSLMIAHDIDAIDDNGDGRDGVYVTGVDGTGEFAVWKETNGCDGLQTRAARCGPACPPGALRRCPADVQTYPGRAGTPPQGPGVPRLPGVPGVPDAPDVPALPPPP